MLLVISFSYTVAGQNEYTVQLIISDSIAQESIPAFKKKHKDSLSVRKALQSIQNYFVANEYLTASFDSVIYSRDIVSAYLFVGQKYDNANIINEIGVTGIDPDDSILSISEYLDYADNILEYCENNGYPFAEVSISELQWADSCFYGRAHLKLSAYVSIDSVRVFGYDGLPVELLTKIIGVRNGDAFSQEAIDNIDSKIKQLSYVKLLTPPVVVFNSDMTVSIHLFMEEVASNSFSAIAGFSNSEDDSEIQLTGVVDIGLENSFANAESFELEWTRTDKYSQKLYSETEFPYLFLSDIGLTGDFLFKREDSSFVKVNYSPGLYYYFSVDNKCKLAYRRISSQLGDLDSTYLETEYANIDYVSNLFEFAYYFGQEYVMAPEKAEVYAELVLSTGKQQNSKNTQLPDSIYDELSMNENYFEISSNFFYFQPTFNAQFISFNIKTAYVYSDELFENELLEFGGVNSLRGHDEESFDASFYTITGIEYTFSLSGTSNVYLFYDQAYFQNHTRTSNFDGYPFGFGAGMTLYTTKGILSLCYALGSRFKSPLKFSASKIHIGYRTRF